MHLCSILLLGSTPGRLYYITGSRRYRPTNCKNKSANDFVSEVDVASEEAIINILKTAYPTPWFLGEESGFSDKDADYIWIIDPLDGTTNFLHQFQYCISNALMHKGDITHAVIYDPNRNDLFTATKGAGAY